MFSIFKKSGIKKISDIEKLINKEGAEKAGQVIRTESDNGNLTCQIFLSDMLLLMIDTEKNPAVLKDISEQFVLHSTRAAMQGDGPTQYNLAKYLISMVSKDIKMGDGKLSETGFISLQKAKKFYTMAAEKGFKPAAESLNNLQELFEWAENQEFV